MIITKMQYNTINWTLNIYALSGQNKYLPIKVIFVRNNMKGFRQTGPEIKRKF